MEICHSFQTIITGLSIGLATGFLLGIFACSLTIK
jgi:ABC-type nitrate/sulfonate/bicarbonate transport system permease component